MTYIYHAPTLTVDVVIFQLIAGKLCVLLIERTNEPFRGKWALPGGYNAAGDTTLDAMERVLTTKVGINTADLPVVEQLSAFDTVARDPRGHAVSITYMGLAHDLTPKVSDGTQRPTFFPVDELPALAFDHADIISYARKRLATRVASSTAVVALLPPTFTLTQLQMAYEAIYGRSLDKRNFRKKFLAIGSIEPAGDYHKDGAHRPAMLYRFLQPKPQPLVRDF